MINKDDILVIVLLIAIGVILYKSTKMLYQRYTEGFINTLPDMGPIGTAGMRNYFNETSRFINFDLTDKPRGNNGPFPIYYWWKNLFNDQLNNQYKDCDQYRCQTKHANGYDAKPGFNLINGVYEDPTANLQSVANLNFGTDCGYYANPIEFCNKYPQYELCPNNWITPKHPVRQSKTCDLYTPQSWQVPYDPHKIVKSFRDE